MKCGDCFLASLGTSALKGCWGLIGKVYKMRLERSDLEATGGCLKRPNRRGQNPKLLRLGGEALAHGVPVAGISRVIPPLTV
jgi:hypothetical protein